MRNWTTIHRWVAGPVTFAFAGISHGQESSEGIGVADVRPTLSSGHASVSVGLYTGRAITGQREVGGHLILEVPFGRLVAPRAGAVIADEPPAEPQKSPAPEARPRPAVAVKPWLARACVQAAWRAHGLGNLDMLDRMRSRAQTSALLPETRFRFSRDWDQSYRLTPTSDDPYRLQETNGGGRTIEGRLTWKLDRLLFVDEELSMERLRVQRMQLRSRLAGEVLRALFDWQRARIAAADPALDDAEHVDAVVRGAEAEALLDVLTGGWFSSWLGR